MILLIALLVTAPIRFDPVGDLFYMQCPQLIVQAIRHAEGVPSYGIVYLARRAGGLHRAVREQDGRRAAAALLHRTHRRWMELGRRVPFLSFLAQTWAPTGVASDPHGLNKYWPINVGWYLAKYPCR